MKCPEPGCTGEIDPDGYCTVTGMKVSTLTSAPVTSAPSPTSAPSSPSATTATRATGTTRTTGSSRSTLQSRLGAGIVTIPRVAPRDPATAVLDNPVVPESKRVCASCGEPVGRSRDGIPGRTEGFCAKCGHQFSFTPKLGPGDLVGGQYEVVGCLAHGGLGWIYLARARNVDMKPVVLKGLLNTGDADALTAATAERRFLAEVDHPDIVKIINFVRHGSDGYIVMEYVGGTSLRGLLEAHRDANDGAPLPASHALAYVIEILPALGYLHQRGLLFCDFKPDNVMQTEGRLKLIDLGGVYRVDDDESPMYGTRGYQAPEIAETGPTYASDLYTVGRTLAVLCTNFRGFQSTYQYSLPSPSEVPLYATYDSLYRLLLRATAPSPADRFQSADEMSAQLVGVLREVVSSETGTPAPGASELFTPELLSATDAPDWRALPALLVSADDPAAGFLASVTTTVLHDPDALVDALAQAPESTVEVELRRARALIDSGRVDEAEAVLDSVSARDQWDWRVAWFRGLSRLSTGEPEAALAEFQTVYRAASGELAVKVALAFAAEAAGRFTEATPWYDIASRTDPAFTSASFGLARCRLALDDTDGAVRAYERVPQSSIAYVDAQVAKVGAMLGATALGAGDVAAAGEVVGRLPRGEARDRLTADVLTAALPLVYQNGAGNGPPVLGHPMTEEAMRRGLEETYRALARRSDPGEERIALVDRANQVRPRTLV